MSVETTPENKITFFLSLLSFVCPGDGVKHPSRFECDGSTNICPPQWSCYENVACCISLTLLKKPPPTILTNEENTKRHSTKSQTESTETTTTSADVQPTVPTKSTQIEIASSTDTTLSIAVSDATIFNTDLEQSENKNNPRPLSRKQIQASKRANQRPQVQDNLDGANLKVGPPAIEATGQDLKTGQELLPPPDFAALLPFPIDQTKAPYYFPTPNPPEPEPLPNPTNGFRSSTISKPHLTQYGSKFSFENR